MTTKDGYVEVVSGRAKVSDPTGDGRYASINPCDANINVYINGDRITRTTIVTEKDHIEFKAREDEKGKAVVCVKITDDGMSATLTVDKTLGRQYSVKDSPKTSLLNVSSECMEDPSLSVTLAQCMNKLKEAGVASEFIDEAAVNMLAAQHYGGSAVVARGKPPVDGRDSMVKYLFQSGKYRNPDFDTDKKINLLDHTVMPTVKIGELLARKVALAVPGQDGQKVTGEIVKASKGKETIFRAGTGTTLMDNDTKIVATINGRPMFKGDTVTVVPVLDILHNIDPKTGNVYFDGDVRVRGNIMDNMKIVTEGNVTVLGNVLQANLIAGGSVTVAGNIISGEVCAGRSAANSLCVLPKIRSVYSILKKDFFDTNSGIWLSGYRDMRKRFPSIFDERINKLEALIEKIKSVLSLIPDEEVNLIEDILEGLDSIYKKGGMNTSTKQVIILCEKVEKYLDVSEVLSSKDADSRFAYAQNSLIQACGDVVITGRGTYQTDIVAKGSIIFLNRSSVVLGGTLIAGNKIDMGIVGSPAGVKTCCEVLEEDGKINASYFFGNTTLIINGKKQITN